MKQSNRKTAGSGSEYVDESTVRARIGPEANVTRSDEQPDAATLLRSSGGKVHVPTKDRTTQAKAEDLGDHSHLDEDKVRQTDRAGSMVAGNRSSQDPAPSLKTS